MTKNKNIERGLEKKRYERSIKKYSSQIAKRLEEVSNIIFKDKDLIKDEFKSSVLIVKNVDLLGSAFDVFFKKLSLFKKMLIESEPDRREQLLNGFIAELREEFKKRGIYNAVERFFQFIVDSVIIPEYYYMGVFPYNFYDNINDFSKRMIYSNRDSLEGRGTYYISGKWDSGGSEKRWVKGKKLKIGKRTYDPTFRTVEYTNYFFFKMKNAMITSSTISRIVDSVFPSIHYYDKIKESGEVISKEVEEIKKEIPEDFVNHFLDYVALSKDYFMFKDFVSERIAKGEYSLNYNDLSNEYRDILKERFYLLLRAMKVRMIRDGKADEWRKIVSWGKKDNLILIGKSDLASTRNIHIGSPRWLVTDIHLNNVKEYLKRGTSIKNQKYPHSPNITPLIDWYRYKNKGSKKSMKIYKLRFFIPEMENLLTRESYLHEGLYEFNFYIANKRRFEKFVEMLNERLNWWVLLEKSKEWIAKSKGNKATAENIIKTLKDGIADSKAIIEKYKNDTHLASSALESLSDDYDIYVQKMASTNSITLIDIKNKRVLIGTYKTIEQNPSKLLEAMKNADLILTSTYDYSKPEFSTITTFIKLNVYVNKGDGLFVKRSLGSTYWPIRITYYRQYRIYFPQNGPDGFGSIFELYSDKLYAFIQDEVRKIIKEIMSATAKKEEVMEVGE